MLTLSSPSLGLWNSSALCSCIPEGIPAGEKILVPKPSQVQNRSIRSPWSSVATGQSLPLLPSVLTPRVFLQYSIFCHPRGFFGREEEEAQQLQRNGCGCAKVPGRAWGRECPGQQGWNSCWNSHSRGSWSLLGLAQTLGMERRARKSFWNKNKLSPLDKSQISLSHEPDSCSRRSHRDLRAPARGIVWLRDRFWSLKSPDLCDKPTGCSANPLETS